MILPPQVTAGNSFSIAATGSGPASLYIVGPAQTLKRDIQLGAPFSIPAGVLYNAGHYVVVLTGSSGTDSAELDVVPADTPATLGFLAKPSRLPVGLHDGISGTVYVFDAYHNLITTPMPASLNLMSSSGSDQSRTVQTRDGLAWANMDSAPREGVAQFTARVGAATSTRIVQQVPGDPCSISISARPDGNKLQVQTAPVKDCSGNPIPDGTIVTFTETTDKTQTTVDVPLKQGVASVTMPAYPGSKISAASGVVAGNEIRWGGSK
jgi:hypothetical protein